MEEYGTEGWKEGVMDRKKGSMKERRGKEGMRRGWKGWEKKRKLLKRRGGKGENEGRAERRK